MPPARAVDPLAELPGTRCVAHPSRPAVDHCPECGRLRCGADAVGAGCAVCRPASAVARATAAPTLLELLVRAALAASVVAVPAGWVLSEYVGAPVYLRYLAPLIVGVSCGAAASAATKGPRPPRFATALPFVAALYALLGTALGFVLEGTYGVLSGALDVLGPYVAAVAGAWLWAAPPRRR